MSLFGNHSSYIYTMQNSSVTKVPARKSEFFDASQKKHFLCIRITAFTHFALVSEIVKS